MKRFWRDLACVSLAVVLAGLLPMPVAAKLSEEQLYFYGQNNILFYDGGADTCGFGTIAGSTVFEKVLTYLLSIGLNEVGAAGIYGNMMNEGFGGGVLLRHEEGVNERRDIGTWYRAATHYGPNGLLVKEEDVRDLWNPKIMHGMGFIGWSFGRRVNLLNALKEAGGLDKYATEWDSVNGRYVYDKVPYDEMVEMIGQSTTDAILVTELEFFFSEHEGRKVTQDDISAQGIAKYGIVAGMPILEALNLLATPEEAAELFYTTSEAPGKKRLEGDKRRISAAEGYELIKTAGLTASGVTKCGGSGNSVLAEAAVDMAWPNEDGMCAKGNGEMVEWKKGISCDRETNKCSDPCAKSIKPAYREAMIKSIGNDPSSGYYQDCGHFVSAAIRSTGVDLDFPVTWTHNMLRYLPSSSKWREIDNLGNTTNLEAGDVLIVVNKAGNGHIMMYTGSYSEYGDLAQASLNQYTGRMGDVYFSYYGTKFRIFRFIGGE